jgi:hypothetical protein
MDRASAAIASRGPICTNGVPRVQRFALGARSIALSQTFDLGGKQLFLAAKYAVVYMTCQGALSEAAAARGLKRELSANSLVGHRAFTVCFAETSSG